MKRRTVWVPLGRVLAVLVAASAVGSGATLSPRVTTWAANLLGLAVSHSNLVIDSALGMVVVLLLIVGPWRWAARRSRHAASGADTKSFASELALALGQSASGRSEAARELARAGHSIGEIARRTRLAQDAVRGVIAVD